MAKNEQRGAKNGKKEHFSLRENDLFCTDSILLRGEHSAVLYGCGRILFYGRERICFSMGNRSVSVFGREMHCSVFSPSGVTVEGKIAGVRYCPSDCNGSCQRVLREEGEA
jgi:hypothetical protein